MKNVILFMASSGFLVPPKQDPSKEQLWVETWKRIDRFLPDLRVDLALEEPDEIKKDEESEDAETKGEETAEGGEGGEDRENRGDFEDGAKEHAKEPVPKSST